MGIVSVLKVKLPHEIPMKLFFLKKIFSSSEKPPSGPTTKSIDESSSNS